MLSRTAHVLKSTFHLKTVVHAIVVPLTWYHATFGGTSAERTLIEYAYPSLPSIAKADRGPNRFPLAT